MVAASLAPSAAVMAAWPVPSTVPLPPSTSVAVAATTNAWPLGATTA